MLGVKMRRVLNLLCIFMLANSVREPAIAASPNHTAPTELSSISDETYRDIAKRILLRVEGLRGKHRSLKDLPSPTFSFSNDTQAVAALHYEYRVDWKLDDPTKPHSKTNARQPVYGEGGYWFSLRFYRGRYEGAAMFFPIEFGDLKLWFEYGHAGDTSVIVAVTDILGEENEKFCKEHPWQEPNKSVQRTRLAPRR